MTSIKINYLRLTSIFTLAFLLQCSDNSAKESERQNAVQINEETEEMMNEQLDTITLGAGCFWCVEAIFDQLEGVDKVESGYTGGSINNPTYNEICTGKTGHTEVCQLTYNRAIISLSEILEVFFQIHDPTTLNRQGADVGTQYRSAIFYHAEEQKLTAEKIIMKLNNAGVWPNPIATEVTQFETFFIAEDNHQTYYENNMNQPYCRAVIQPKLDKFKKVFKEKLKN